MTDLAVSVFKYGGVPDILSQGSSDMVLCVKMTDLAVYVFRYGVADITVQVSSKGYLCACRLGKAITRSFRFLRSFPNVAFEIVSKCLIDDGAFKKGRRAAITCSTPLDMRSTV